MKKKIPGVLFFTLFTFALVGCGSNQQQTAKPSDSAQKAEETSGSTNNDSNKQEEVKPTGKVVEAKITATTFDYDVKEIKANVGDTIKLTVVNDVGTHGVAIDEFGVDIKGGETAEFVAAKAGEFDYYCSVMCGVGHDKMLGKLIVK